MIAFWCLDCHKVITLDVHGRCENCQSDAVVAAVPTPARPAVVRAQTTERALTTEQLAEEVIQSIKRMSPADKARARRAFRPAARVRHWSEVVQ